MKQIRNGEIDDLFRVIKTLETLDEFYDFFGDVCTIKEVLDMAQRLSVAKMLEDGKSYVDISEKTGAQERNCTLLTLLSLNNGKGLKTFH